MVNHSAREVERLIKEEKDGPNPVATDVPDVERYEWKDKASGVVHLVPKGIDPGWDYHPGKAGFRI